MYRVHIYRVISYNPYEQVEVVSFQSENCISSSIYISTLEILKEQNSDHNFCAWFEPIKPTNAQAKCNYKHGVSETLVGLMNRFERGEVTKEQYLAVVDALQAVSIDERQHSFFDAIKALLDKVERVKLGLDDGE